LLLLSLLLVLLLLSLLLVLLLLSHFCWLVFIFVGPVVVVVVGVVVGPIVVVSPVVIVVGHISAPQADRACGSGGSGGDPHCPRKLEPKIQQKTY